MLPISVKRLVFLLMAWISFGVIKTQNLVPNGSFDEVVDCEMQFGVFSPGWGTANNFGTPDHYHLCSEEDLLQPPEILWCNYLLPRSGDGFAGVCTYGAYPREYLQIELTETLEPNRWYYVEMYVSPYEICDENLVSTDAIGIH